MGEGGGGGIYTPLLLGFNIGSFKKVIILPCSHLGNDKRASGSNA